MSAYGCCVCKLVLLIRPLSLAETNIKNSLEKSERGKEVNLAKEAKAAEQLSQSESKSFFKSHIIMCH